MGPAEWMTLAGIIVAPGLTYLGLRGKLQSDAERLIADKEIEYRKSVLEDQARFREQLMEQIGALTERCRGLMEDVESLRRDLAECRANHADALTKHVAAMAEISRLHGILERRAADTGARRRKDDE